MSSIKRIRELAIEVVVAVLLVIGLLAYTSYTKPNWPYIALAANTVVVFGYLIVWFRGSWKRVLFWAYVTALFVAHIGVYAFVLARVGTLPLIYYVILSSGELGVFVAFLHQVLPNRTDPE